MTEREPPAAWVAEYPVSVNSRSTCCSWRQLSRRSMRNSVLVSVPGRGESGLGFCLGSVDAVGANRRGMKGFSICPGKIKPLMNVK